MLIVGVMDYGFPFAFAIAVAIAFAFANHLPFLAFSCLASLVQVLLDPLGKDRKAILKKLGTGTVKNLSHLLQSLVRAHLKDLEGGEGDGSGSKAVEPASPPPTSSDPLPLPPSPPFPPPSPQPSS